MAERNTAIADAITQGLQPLRETIDVQCALVGILLGLLIDRGVITSAELSDRIEIMTRGRPLYQQQLLAMVQQPLAGRRQ